jgi:hypothetical protein
MSCALGLRFDTQVSFFSEVSTYLQGASSSILTSLLVLVLVALMNVAEVMRLAASNPSLILRRRV